MRKPAIPSTPKPNERRDKFDASLKEVLEIITGRRADPIKVLDASTATAADCAAKINEILARLQ